jgi:hypothetical protein
MKKLVAVLLLAVASTSAMAQHHGHGGYHRHGGYRSGWVAPAIIGGVIGYGLSRPYYEPYYSPPVVVQQPTVIYTQPTPVVVQPQCTRYIYQDQYGRTTGEETRCN